MADDNFNKYCEQLLVQYKRRNTKAVARHLRGVRDILSHEYAKVCTDSGRTGRRETTWSHALATRFSYPMHPSRLSTNTCVFPFHGLYRLEVIQLKQRNRPF